MGGSGRICLAIAYSAALTEIRFSSHIMPLTSQPQLFTA
jgi:hypothetical protein